MEKGRKEEVSKACGLEDWGLPFKWCLNRGSKHYIKERVEFMSRCSPRQPWTKICMFIESRVNAGCDETSVSDDCNHEMEMTSLV